MPENKNRPGQQNQGDQQPNPNQDRQKQGQQGQQKPGQEQPERNPQRQGQPGFEQRKDQGGGMGGQAGEKQVKDRDMGIDQDRNKMNQGQQRPKQDELKDISKGVTDEDEDMDEDERITQRTPSQGQDVERPKK